MGSTDRWHSSIKVALLYAHEKSRDLRQKRRSFTTLSRKPSWLPRVLSSGILLLVGGSSRKGSQLPALFQPRLLTNGKNRCSR